MRTSFRTAVTVATVLFPALAAAVPNPVATYTFNDSFASIVAGAPALTPVDPQGVGGFTTDTVFGSSRRVYSFGGNSLPPSQQGGLSLDVSSLLAGHGDEYSLGIVFKFTQAEGLWRRIVDVQNRQSDEGFYVDSNDRLNIFPAADGDLFTNDTYHDVFLVNDHGTVSFYLDGQAPTIVNARIMDIGADNRINFFLDNVVFGGQGEYSGGSVAMIQIYDRALDALPAIPEPDSYALMALGLGVLGWVSRRRRQPGG